MHSRPVDFPACELLTKLEGGKDYAENYVRIIYDKLLIFPTKASTKASYVYDLYECDITISTDEDFLEVEHPFLRKLYLKDNHFSLVNLNKIFRKIQDILNSRDVD